MNTKCYRPLGSLGILALALAMASAQDAPKPDDKKQEPQIAEQKDLYNSLTLGYQSFFSQGRLNALGQYVRPQTGAELFELKLVAPVYGTRPWASFNFRGLPGQTFNTDGATVLGGGTFILGFSHSDYSHLSSDWQPANDGDEKLTQIVARQRLAPNVGAFETYREDDHKLGLVAPTADRDNLNQTFGLGIQARALGGDTGVQYSDSRFRDRTSLLPETVRRNVSGFYSAELFPGFNLEGGLNYATNQIYGRKDTAVHGVTVNSVLDPWENTSLQFNFSAEDVNDPNALTETVKKRYNSGLRLLQRLPGNWLAQAGYSHRESQRLRADQSYVDIPKWDRYDARLSGRIKGGARVTLRGYSETLTSAPTFQTDDPRQLYWSDQSMAQLKVDGGNEQGTAYGSLTYRYRQNTPRGLHIGQTNVTLGSSYVYSPAVLGYVEYSIDSYQIKSPTDTTSGDFGPYFPNAQTFAVGLDYTPHPEESLSASLNHYKDNNFDGNQLTFQYRRQLSPERSISLTLAPWHYQDGLYNTNDYNVTFVSLKCSVKF